MKRNKIRFKMRSYLLYIAIVLLTGTALASQNVDIHDINEIPSFDPANITIMQGTTVNWTNNDADLAHTVTSDTNGIFDSGSLSPGETFEFTFNDIGTFNYHCSIHPFMHGKVTVITPTFNVSGYKINDLNGNGRWESGEPTIPDWNITLANATTGIVIANISTDNHGLYNFENVTNGSYVVTEEMKTGWRNITPLSRQVTVVGHDATRQDFKNQIIDTILPIINSVVLDTYTPTIGSDIHISVNATDNVGVSNVAVDNIELIRDADTQTWIGTIVAEEGIHSVNVSARDFSGNMAWNNSTMYTGISNDIIMPTINSVELNTSTPFVGDNILVTVNATDNVGVSNVAVDNIELIQDTDDANIWIGTIVAQEGIHSVNVSARDAAGNTAWDNSTMYTGIINDIIMPTINSVELNTSTPFAGDNILVTVNATDNVGVSNVAVVSNIAVDNIELTNQGGDIWSGTIIAQEGIHSVNVMARDAAGNTAWDNSTMYTGMNSSIRFELTLDHSAIAVNQSEDALYMLTIENTGQVMDTYDFTIDNPNNANVSISDMNISLDPGDSSTLTLTVNSSVPGRYRVNVTAISESNPLLSRTVSTRTKVMSPSYIREFDVGNGTRAGSIRANATITNLGTETHWFVVVIDGVEPITGYPLVGTGTVHLDAGQTIKIPVLITVPAGAETGEYQLFAGIYPFDNGILDPEELIGTIQGPMISNVS